MNEINKNQEKEKYNVGNAHMVSALNGDRKESV